MNVPTHKSGDPNGVKNYRPISLPSTLNKAFTAVLTGRIQTAAEESGVFSEDQGGARKTRDVRYKLAICNSIISDAARREGPLLFLQTDISKAFDCVWTNIVQQSFEFFGFPKELIDMLTAILCENVARVRIGSTFSEEFKVGRGTRQGDALSPTVFIIVFELVIRRIAQASLEHRGGYAVKGESTEPCQGSDLKWAWQPMDKYDCCSTDQYDYD